MPRHFNNLIVGQGLAGSAIAWNLHWAGQSVLIIDHPAATSASRISAGLITPVTGKRLVRSRDFDAYWKAALTFYQRVEHETGQTFFEVSDMLRVFATEASREEFLKRSGEEALDDVDEWEGPLQSDQPNVPGIRMTPAGRLNVKAYLSATQDFFESRSLYQQAKIDFENDVQFEAGKIRIKSLDISADRLCVCQGCQPNDLFPAVPNNRSRGDILKVRINNYKRPEVVHRSIWIAPNADGTQHVGATYDWKKLEPVPTADGREEVLTKLSRLVSGPVNVEQHVAGVRPTMKDYEPVIGRHSTLENVFVLNGLGSKGTLRAPQLASDLSRLMLKNQLPPEKTNYQRLLTKPPAGTKRRPLTTLAQEIVGTHVTPGDTVLDATVGNGFDTCFLSDLVGPKGTVIGFDVQAAALSATEQRLAKQNSTNVQLRQESHERIADAVSPQTVAAVMFNLGYLPRSDHSVVTQPTSSTIAIAAAIDSLKPGGVLTVLSYRGHDGGMDEYNAVEQLLMDHKETHNLQRHDSTPAKTTAPVLFVLEKDST